MPGRHYGLAAVRASSWVITRLHCGLLPQHPFPLQLLQRRRSSVRELRRLCRHSPDSAPVPAPAETSPDPSPDAGLQALPQTPDLSPGPTSAGPVAPAPTPIKHSPTTEPGDPALNTSNSFWLDNYPLNDLYQYLARQAGYPIFPESVYRCDQGDRRTLQRARPDGQHA